jgi:hypothetical protein
MNENEPGIFENKEFVQNSTVTKLLTIQTHVKDGSSNLFASLHDSLSFPSYKTISFVCIFEHDAIAAFETQKVPDVPLGPL